MRYTLATTALLSLTTSTWAILKVSESNSSLTISNEHLVAGVSKGLKKYFYTLTPPPSSLALNLIKSIKL